MKTMIVDAGFGLPNGYTGIVVTSTGSVYCLKNGKRHRDDGKPAIIIHEPDEIYYYIDNYVVSREAAETYAGLYEHTNYCIEANNVEDITEVFQNISKKVLIKRANKLLNKF